MTNHVALSLDYNGVADLFNAYGMGKDELSMSGLSKLAARSTKLNELLRALRAGLKAKLYSLKGSDSTLIYNMSGRQSRRIEHKQMSFYHNGDSMPVLGRIAFNLSDSPMSRNEVKRSPLLLADTENDLEPGGSYHFDAGDDFDTFHYNIESEATLKARLMTQLSDFSSLHQDDDVEFVIVSKHHAAISKLVHQEKGLIPANITVKVIDFNWHQLLNDHLDNGLYFLKDLDATIRLTDILGKQMGKVNAYSPRADWDKLLSLRYKVSNALDSLIKYYPKKAGNLEKLARIPYNFTSKDLTTVRQVIGEIADDFVSPLTDKEPEMLAWCAAKEILSEQGQMSPVVNLAL